MLRENRTIDIRTGLVIDGYPGQYIRIKTETRGEGPHKLTGRFVKQRMCRPSPDECFLLKFLISLVPEQILVAFYDPPPFSPNKSSSRCNASSSSKGRRSFSKQAQTIHSQEILILYLISSRRLLILNRLTRAVQKFKNRAYV